MAKNEYGTALTLIALIRSARFRRSGSAATKTPTQQQPTPLQNPLTASLLGISPPFITPFTSYTKKKKKKNNNNNHHVFFICLGSALLRGKE
jgi:hypothetical protein